MRNPLRRPLSPSLKVAAFLLLVTAAGIAAYLWWPRAYAWSVDVKPDHVKFTFRPPQKPRWVLVSRASEYRYTRKNQSTRFSFTDDKTQKMQFISPGDNRTSEVILRLPQLEVDGFRRNKDESTTVPLLDGNIYVVSCDGVSVPAEFYWLNGQPHNATVYIEAGSAKQYPGRTRLVIDDDQSTASEQR